MGLSRLQRCCLGSAGYEGVAPHPRLGALRHSAGVLFAAAGLMSSRAAVSWLSSPEDEWLSL